MNELDDACVQRFREAFSFVCWGGCNGQGLGFGVYGLMFCVSCGKRKMDLLHLHTFLGCWGLCISILAFP